MALYLNSIEVPDITSYYLLFMTLSSVFAGISETFLHFYHTYFNKPAGYSTAGLLN